MTCIINNYNKEGCTQKSGCAPPAELFISYKNPKKITNSLFKQ